MSPRARLLGVVRTEPVVPDVETGEHRDIGAAWFETPAWHHVKHQHIALYRRIAAAVPASRCRRPPSALRAELLSRPPGDHTNLATGEIAGAPQIGSSK